MNNNKSLIKKNNQLKKRKILKPSKGRGLKKFGEDLEKNLEKAEEKFEEKFEEDIKEIEKWIVERKKFFIKLGKIILIVVLLILFLRIF